MKHLPILALTLALLVGLPGCNTAAQNTDTYDPQSSQSELPDMNDTSAPNDTAQKDDGHLSGSDSEEDRETAITITVGEQAFSAVLNDSDAAAMFLEQLPLTLDMSELNGNEKYFYLDESLPTDAERPGQISTGDLMLYGDNCLVLFYQSFTSSYSYTRLGRLENPDGLAAAVGGGSVTVRFEAEG